jgi:hypothetical protein
LQAEAQQTLFTQKPRLQSAGFEQDAPVCDLKAAVTVMAEVTLAVQVVPLVLVQPLQVENTPVAAGDATSWTDVP